MTHLEPLGHIWSMEYLRHVWSPWSHLEPLGHNGKFDSSVDNISTYLTRLQLYSMANQVKGDLRAAALLRCIGGKTYRVLNDMFAMTLAATKFV